MNSKDHKSNPVIVQETIDRLIKKMRYRKKVRADVRAELEGHFEDALAECQNDQERMEVAQRLVEDFGDTRLLAQLIRRAKKRCRSLWVKVMIRMFQVVGLCVLYFLLCVSRLYIGKPTIKVDTVTRLNEGMQQGQAETQNAWPGILQAATLLKPLPQPLFAPLVIPRYQDTNEVQRQSLEHYFQDNQNAFYLLHQAVQKPHCWRSFTPAIEETITIGNDNTEISPSMGTVWLSAVLMQQQSQDLSQCLQLALILNLRREWYTERGDTDKALTDAETLFCFGHHLLGTGLLKEQRTGIAIATLFGLGPLLDVLNRAKIEDERLAVTERIFSPLADWERAWISLEQEKVLAEDMLQRGFTDDGHGNGRPLASTQTLLNDSPSQWLMDLLLFDWPDRKQAQKNMNLFFKNLNILFKTTPWDLQHHDVVLKDELLLSTYKFVNKSGFERAAQLQWHYKMLGQTILTILAIKRYQAQHGQLPESLHVLVTEGLLDEIPRDFYGPGALTYQRRSDQDFILYSWGKNFQDDHGIPGTNEAGRSSQYGSHGDWIFWPPQ